METLLGLVDPDSGDIDQTVGRATGVGRADPRRPPSEIVVELGQLDVDIAVEVDELDPIEHRLVVEHPLLGQQGGDRVLGGVVHAASLQHGGVDRCRVEAPLLELVGHEPGLEELAPGQAGHDDRDPHLDGPGDGEGVDRLVAALTDVGVAVETVGEDLVHRLGGHELVGDPEIRDAAPDVVLRPFGDEAVVEREGVDLPAPVHELVQRVGGVLAARQEVETVVVAGATGPGGVTTLVEVGRGPEPVPGLGFDGLELATRGADPERVDLDAGNIVAETTSNTPGDRAPSPGIGRMPHADERGVDRRMSDERGLDLGRFEADAAHLELIVLAASEDEHAGPLDPDPVARAVPGPGGRITAGRVTEDPGVLRTKRQRTEPFRRQLGSMEIAGRHAGPGDEQLAPHAGGRELTEGVERDEPGAGRRVPDRHVGALVGGRVVLVDHAPDDGLGRAVLVEDPDGPGTGVAHAFRHRSAERLAAHDDGVERQAPVGDACEDLQLRRGGLQEGQPIVGRDPAEGLHGFLGEHDGPSTDQRGQEDAGDGEVEHEGRVQGDPMGAAAALGVRIDGERQIVGQASMGDRYALREPRRAGGVQDVGAVVGPDGRELDVRGPGAVHRNGLEHGEEIGIGRDRVVASGRVLRVEEDEPATGPQHTVDRHEHLEASAHAHADGSPRLETVGDEPPGQGVGSTIEFGGRHEHAVVFRDDPVGRRRQPLGDRVVHRPPGRARRCIGVEQGQLVPLGLGEHGGPGRRARPGG